MLAHVDRAHYLSDGGQPLVDLFHAGLSERLHSIVDGLSPQRAGRGVAEERALDRVGDGQPLEDGKPVVKAGVRAMRAAGATLERRTPTTHRAVELELDEGRLVGRAALVADAAYQPLRLHPDHRRGD